MVRVGGRYGTAMKVATRQGCPLLPHLYKIFAEVMMRRAIEKMKGGVKIDGVRLTDLLYTDDIILLAESKKLLQKRLSKLQVAS